MPISLQRAEPRQKMREREINGDVLSSSNALRYKSIADMKRRAARMSARPTNPAT